MPKPTPVAAAGNLLVYLLDMGSEKFGDCIVARLGESTILIDGGHPGDWQGGRGMKSIPDQLGDILKSSPPFPIDLLVVTHCHSDHIGCLPELVERGIIDVKCALLPDEKLGFGRSDDYVMDSAPSAADRIAALLREEDRGELSDGELAEFIADAVNLETAYNNMIDKLGTKVVRFGRDDHSPVEDAFQAFGLKVLGPTLEQFLCCAQAIAGFHSDSAHYAADIADMADPRSLTGLYRRILADSDSLGAGAVDRPGKGAAINDQSIVLKLSAGGGSILLTGDMQFAKPEVSCVIPLMPALRGTVRAAGPYIFVKLPHHGSYNGFNDSIMQDWKDTAAYGISGGQNDTGHPDPGVLQLLEQNTSSIKWARTDHNGMITDRTSDGTTNLEIEKGQLNDPVPNSDVAGEMQPLEQPAYAPAAAVPRSTGGVVVTSEQGELRLTEVRWKPTGVSLDYVLPIGGPVRKDPAVRVRDMQEAPPPSTPAVRLGGGRNLPPLLFITYQNRLMNNLGTREATAALDLIRKAGQTVYDVKNPDNPYAEVREQLSRGKYQGVVLVGGYDVVPPQRLDALPPSIRNGVGRQTSDADNFIVWCDDIYGDLQGNGLPDLPVSRIPDAKSPKLVMAALGAVPPSPGKARFGIRNVKRPFANGPFDLLPGAAQLLVSQETVPANVGQNGAAGDFVYCMLHGSDMDASRFWGETANGGMLEALNVTNVPNHLSGVVFTGCCWGALTVQTMACNAMPGVQLGIRTTGMSIALSYLHAGVSAFVGCTGTHYSPCVADYNYFGGPMHTAFWKHCTQGETPAQALFNAKLDYIQGMPHGQTGLNEQAIEFKILKEYTCLGLGW
ncbi:MAG: MBL fold metallo-hydrolase [Desulfobaccales bacterium]